MNTALTFIMGVSMLKHLSSADGRLLEGRDYVVLLLASWVASTCLALSRYTERVDGVNGPKSNNHCHWHISDSLKIV